jgi:hypothetical protein
MKQNLESTLNDFLGDENENAFNEKVKSDKRKFVKTDKSIIERLDVIIVENGKQLLREVY